MTVLTLLFGATNTIAASTPKMSLGSGIEFVSQDRLSLPRYRMVNPLKSMCTVHVSQRIADSRYAFAGKSLLWKCREKSID